MKHIAAALFLALAGPAHAGDPCPIGVTFVDLGVPEWLDRDALLTDLSSSYIAIGINFAYGDDGVTLRRVFPDSPAARAGFMRGDVIHQIGDTPVGPQGSVSDAVSTVEAGQTLATTLTRAGERMTLPLTVERGDPVPRALARVMSQGDCRESQFRPATPDERAVLTPQFTDSNRAFRCNTAHRDLFAEPSTTRNGGLYVLRGSIDEESAYGNVYVLRGSRRILMVFPDWGSVCADANALDGAGMDIAAKTVAESLLADFIENRHANP